MSPPLNQTPPVALLKSELIPMIVLQIGLSFAPSIQDTERVIELSGTLHGDFDNFYPTVLNSHPESAYKMAWDVYMYKFMHGPPPMWFINYSY